jgi:hypothetical protein
MPLTGFQARVTKLLAGNRSPDNHLAGGAAVHLAPNSKRYSNDLDYFQDTVERVAEAYAADSETLVAKGYVVSIDMKQPGYIRARVTRGEDVTKIEWAHDSAWRFLPSERNETCGYTLHPIDLAINKLLALVGRDEPRDFLDVLHVHDEVLPLGALIWAAVGKDPGFTPLSLLELLRRRGKYRPEDFARLHLVAPVDLPSMKSAWLVALEEAEAFVRRQDPNDLGCLFYSPRKMTFIAPTGGDTDCAPHFGRPGGVLPLPSRH